LAVKCYLRIFQTDWDEVVKIVMQGKEILWICKLGEEILG
jgi:hypothetical protein